MAQITYTNPNARKKSVYYTGSSTIAEGMPLCYSAITNKNWFGYSDSANAVGDTTAEGSQNEGKYIYVENPMVENSSTGTWTQATKLITDDGAEFDTLQVGMMVNVSSATDSDIDGVWEITAQDATANTITLGNMTDAEAALVTDAIADVVVTINNVNEFAGVVAAGSPNIGETGPGNVEIYVPNGAIVPVKSGVATAVGKTILGVVSNTLTLSNPVSSVPDFATTSSGDLPGTSDGKAVAVAQETLSAAGLCLARLDPSIFVNQGGLPGYDLETGAGTSNVTINRSFIDFKNTAGHCQALHYRATLTGDGTDVGDGHRGVFRFETFIGAEPTKDKNVFGIHSHLEIGSDFPALYGAHVAPLALTVRTKNTDPDLSDVGSLSAINIQWHLRKTTTGALTNPLAAEKTSIIYINADTTATQPEMFMFCENPTNIGGYAATGTAAFSTSDIMIPVRLGSTMYYLCAFLDTGL